MLRSWPTLSGTTMLREGDRVAQRQHADPVGQPARAADGDVLSAPSAGTPTSIIPARRSRSATGAGTRAGRWTQRELHAQHPVLVLGAGLVGVDVGAELDHPAEGPALDLHLLVDLALGTWPARGVRRGSACDPRSRSASWSTATPASSAVTIARGGSDA